MLNCAASGYRHKHAVTLYQSLVIEIKRKRHQSTYDDVVCVHRCTFTKQRECRTMMTSDVCSVIQERERSAVATRCSGM